MVPRWWAVCDLWAKWILSFPVGLDFCFCFLFCFGFWSVWSQQQKANYKLGRSILQTREVCITFFLVWNRHNLWWSCSCADVNICVLSGSFYPVLWFCLFCFLVGNTYHKSPVSQHPVPSHKEQRRTTGLGRVLGSANHWWKVRWGGCMCPRGLFSLSLWPKWYHATTFQVAFALIKYIGNLALTQGGGAHFRYVSTVVF